MMKVGVDFQCWVLDDTEIGWMFVILSSVPAFISLYNTLSFNITK